MKENDLYHVAQKAANRGVGKVGVIAVSSGQEVLDVARVESWARDRGVILSIYRGWEGFLREVFFWSPHSPSEIVGEAYRAVLTRAMEIEVSDAGINFWISAAKSR